MKIFKLPLIFTFLIFISSCSSNSTEDITPYSFSYDSSYPNTTSYLDPEINLIRGQLTSVNTDISNILKILQFAEKSYLNFEDGNISKDIMQTRLVFAKEYLQTIQAKAVYSNLKRDGKFSTSFTNFFDQIVI